MNPPHSFTFLFFKFPTGLQILNSKPQRKEGNTRDKIQTLILQSSKAVKNSSQIGWNSEFTWADFEDNFQLKLWFMLNIQFSTEELFFN